MQEGNAIEVRDITKTFKVYYDKGHTLKEKMLFRKRRAYEERHVLNGISFEVKKGEAVGLIGHNGCGKSTTLKLLTKIMYPDSGTIEMNGRVSSLIELGAGFHPDMSGKENIYINASIFGLTKKEIDRRLDDIIAFSELEEFIDNPVRTYSSGMYMRLAFSVAINVDADILLIDEILAVGDAGFQTKCFNRLKEIKANGTTIVIVSHSMGQIEQICNRSIWIHKGKIKAEGRPRDIDPQYLDYMGEQRQVIAEKEQERKKKSKEKETEQKEETQELKEAVPEPAEMPKAEKTRWGNGNARITSIHLLNKKGGECVSFRTNDTMLIKIDYKVQKEVRDAVFGIGIYRIDEVHCYGTNTRIDNIDEFALKQDGSVTVELSPMTLLPGKYLLDIAIESELGIPVDFYKRAKEFEVFSRMPDVGIARIAHAWDMEGV